MTPLLFQWLYLIRRRVGGRHMLLVSRGLFISSPGTSSSSTAGSGSAGADGVNGGLRVLPQGHLDLKRQHYWSAFACQHVPSRSWGWSQWDHLSEEEEEETRERASSISARTPGVNLHDSCTYINIIKGLYAIIRGSYTAIENLLLLIFSPLMEEHMTSRFIPLYALPPLTATVCTWTTYYANIMCIDYLI